MGLLGTLESTIFMKTKKLKNNMFGALGNTWRYNFYMGMQNDMNLEKYLFWIFDSHL